MRRPNCRSASDRIVGAVTGGSGGRQAIEGLIHQNPLSSGLAAMPMDSDSVAFAFDMSHVYASGNIAADMSCNVAAESTGRLLAVRLFNAAHYEGMRRMLRNMIARDTMHQQQMAGGCRGARRGADPLPAGAGGRSEQL